MYRDEGRHHVVFPEAVQRHVDGFSIRRVEALNALVTVLLGHVLIARYNRIVANFGHHATILEAAVEIDHQARIARQHRGRVQVLRKMVDQFSGADVVSDMLFERCIGQSEIFQRSRYDVANVIADQQDFSLAPRINNRVWRRIFGSDN